MKKILLVVGIGAALYYLSKKNKCEALPAGSNEMLLAAFEGKAIRYTNDELTYKIVGGKKIAYTDEKAWANDGKPELITVSKEIYDFFPTDNTKVITPEGLQNVKIKTLNTEISFNPADFREKLKTS